MYSLNLRTRCIPATPLSPTRRWGPCGRPSPRRPATRATIAGKGSASLPIIDISPLMATIQDAGEIAKVAQQLHNACCSVGFLYVTGHGVPKELCSGILEEARHWFHLPMEHKREIAVSPGTAYRGYQALGENVTRFKGGFQRDHHEAINLYLEAAGQAGSPLHGANQWPAQRPSFDAALRQYVQHCLRVGQAIMRGIALGLGLPEGYFETLEGGGTSTDTSYWAVRCIHYPPLATGDYHARQAQAGRLSEAAAAALAGAEVDRGVQLSCGEHSDYGLLTLVNQDAHIPALQVKSACGEWITAAPIPGTFVCNVGDMLRVYSNGLYQSTPHRVLNADPTRSRVSIPFFYEPAFDAQVAPAKQLGRPLFEPVSYGRHLESKILNNFELVPTAA